MTVLAERESHGVLTEVELDAGQGDPEIAARAFSRTHPGFQGRIIVHSRSEPAWAGIEPVPLLAWFDVLLPGRVRWVFVQAG